MGGGQGHGFCRDPSGGSSGEGPPVETIATLTGSRASSPRLLLPAPLEVDAPLSPFGDKETRSQEVTDEPTSQGRSAAGGLQARVLAVTAVVQGAGEGLGGHSFC